MDLQEFLNDVVDLLDIEMEITDETSLFAIEEWDSLSIISFLAMVDVNYGKTMRASDFKEAKTFGDLYKIVKG